METFVVICPFFAASSFYFINIFEFSENSTTLHPETSLKNPFHFNQKINIVSKKPTLENKKHFIFLMSGNQ